MKKVLDRAFFLCYNMYIKMKEELFMTLSDYIGLFYEPFKNYTCKVVYVSVYVDGEWVYKDEEFKYKEERLRVLCKDYLDYDVEVFHVLDNDLFIATSSESFKKEKQRNITIKLKKHKSRKELEAEIEYWKDRIGADAKYIR
jgi:hypothetical protein